MIPVYKTLGQSQDELRKAFENAKDATATIKTESVDKDGVASSGLLNMAEGLHTTLTFWNSQVLPVIPETFTPDSETGTTPRSKL